mmetsp:Transcript_19811/g.50331  ORF Transcript_19811/g.50331 Transcript_19811/m.50331 type:complete len:94 (-) Transcript_19811:84-365(-)
MIAPMVTQAAVVLRPGGVFLLLFKVRVARHVCLLRDNAAAAGLRVQELCLRPVLSTPLSRATSATARFLGPEDGDDVGDMRFFRLEKRHTPTQ